MKKIVIGILMTALLGAASCGLIPEEATFPDRPSLISETEVQYRTEPCARHDVSVEKSVQFRYVAVRTEDLKFEVNGIHYDEFFVKVGDLVKEGQLLVQLDVSDLTVQLEETEKSLTASELRLRQLEESRTLELKKTKIRYEGLPEDQYREAKDAVNASFDLQRERVEDQIFLDNLKKEQCEAEIRERQLLAPFDGMVSYIAQVTPADYSDIDKRVISVADASRSVFYCVTEMHPYFPPGARMTVLCNGTEYPATVMSEQELGLPETEHVEGKRGTVYLVLDEASFDIADNANGYCNIVIERHENVLAVRAEAVREINGAPAVYYVTEQGVRSWKPVETGLAGNQLVEIVSGLQEGEEVIIR